MARYGFVSVLRISIPSPTPKTFDVDRRRLVELDVDAVVIGERRLDDLLLHLAVEDGELVPLVVLPDLDQRVLLGELRERDWSLAPSSGSVGTTTDSSVGGANSRRGGGASPIRSPIWMLPRPQSFAISPAETDVRCSRPRHRRR